MRKTSIALTLNEVIEQLTEIKRQQNNNGEYKVIVDTPEEFIDVINISIQNCQGSKYVAVEIE